MSDPDPWETLEDIDHMSHLTVWLAVRECKADADIEVVNSTTVLQADLSLTGEYRNRETVLNSMRRLCEAGVLKRTDADEWHGGYHWTTTDRGRKAACTIAAKWQEVAEALEIGETSNSDNGDD